MRDVLARASLPAVSRGMVWGQGGITRPGCADLKSRPSELYCMRPRGREEEIETARRERGRVDGRGARAYVGKAVEPPCMTSLRTKPRWLGKREEDERRRGGAWTRGRHFPDETSPSAGAGRTDGRGQGQGTAVRSVPPHEAAAARKERRAARREAARKLKLFGLKFPIKN